MKNSKCVYIIGVVLTSILEIILYLVFICGIVGTMASFVCIWVQIFNGSSCIENPVTDFGVFATVSIIPFLSVLASFLLSYKNSINEIETDLVRCQDMTVQFKKLPNGADLASARMLQSAIYEESLISKEVELKKCKFKKKKYDATIPIKTLKDFCFLVNINFKQDLSEFYHITPCEVELLTVNCNKIDNVSKLVLRNIDNVHLRPCVVKDMAGSRLHNEGEQIYIFIAANPNAPKEQEISSCISGSVNGDGALTKRVLRFSLNFAKKDFTVRRPLMFAITRKLINLFLENSLRHRQILVDLEYRLSSNENNYVAEAQILDVSFRVRRNLKWVKYLKAKKRVLNRDISS